MKIFLLTIFFITLSISLFAKTQDEFYQSLGLIKLDSATSGIQIDLKYSTSNNFLGRPVYENLTNAYLRETALAKLIKAQKLLTKNHPGLHLLVYDAARPLSVQKAMWAIVKGTPQEGYVANPARGSVHNTGLAVDLTLANSNNEPLDMGTPFDYFGDLAQPRFETKYLQSRQLSELQLSNRLILRAVMTNAGFYMIPNEWWHFNALPKNEVFKLYPLIP